MSFYGVAASARCTLADAAHGKRLARRAPIFGTMFRYAEQKPCADYA